MTSAATRAPSQRRTCSPSTRRSVTSRRAAPARPSRCSRPRGAWRRSASASCATTTRSSSITAVGLPLLSSNRNGIFSPTLLFLHRWWLAFWLSLAVSLQVSFVANVHACLLLPLLFLGVFLGLFLAGPCLLLSSPFLSPSPPPAPITPPSPSFEFPSPSYPTTTERTS